MGGIAVVIGAESNTDDGEDIRDIKINFGGGDVVTASAFGPSGDDAPPLPDDYVATVSIDGDSEAAVVGVADADNESLAAPGEVRRYARSSNGVPMVWVWLYGDGHARIENDNGYIELGANGLVTINGNLTVDP